MRPAVAIARHGKAYSRYRRIANRLLPASEASNRLKVAFGDATGSLPKSLCLELVSPELKELPTRKPFFEKLQHLGKLSLDVYLNEYLGTMSLSVDSQSLRHYAMNRHLPALLAVLPTAGSFISEEQAVNYSCDLLTGYVGAITAMTNAADYQEAIRANILSGRQGLANTHLELLSR